MQIIKRDGSKVSADFLKIITAVTKAFKQNNIDKIPAEVSLRLGKDYYEYSEGREECSVEEIQDLVEKSLMAFPEYYTVIRSYINHRDKQAKTRALKSRVDYMKKYSTSGNNASTSSETDDNANISAKNVATLEGEVWKVDNRNVQRYMMKEKLKEMFPDVADQYEKDLDNHIIYTHDESSTPALKQYCMAVSLYPLMLEGVGNMDNVTPSAPTDIQSFSGQVTNLAFLLSSQCKGAVAFGEYFIALNYYIIKEFGDTWYQKLDVITTTEHCLHKKTVKEVIHKAFKQFVWGINQPAGNRSYQSPFINISYYDKTYFDSLFGEFYYPDGTQPQWFAIDSLQRLFLKWFNKLRTKQILTFPVESFAMVHDGTDIVDQNYKELCAEMYAEGHSFFTYISDSADSLASCCRLRNEVSNNTFSPTSGLTGVMTGSCNVITLNMNRIVQDVYRLYQLGGDRNFDEMLAEWLKVILNRVYKYHIAFKTMLYDMEDLGMFSSSNAGYIHINKLFSTIGINGLNEAALFLGLDVSNNEDYFKFLGLILSTIKEANNKNSIRDKKRPFIFNSECVPAESLGIKNYNWDKEDGYVVPEDRNLYNSYFYNAHDNTSVLDKFILHGHNTSDLCDGGSAAHINLEDHLSKEQYLSLIDFAIKEGTSYFTFNIPNSKCNSCKHITKVPIKQCPKCGSNNITMYSRIIGYLRPISNFSEARQVEANKRTYHAEIC